MAEDEREARRQIQAEIEAAPSTGTVVGPSVPYVKYIIEDLYKPSDLPADLLNVAYDKEQALSNLTNDEINWLRLQLMRAAIMFKNGRPALAGNFNEEIKLSVLPAKHLIKLARSREGFERKQQTTQTVIRQSEGTGGDVQQTSGRRWWIFNRRKKPGGEQL